VANLGVALAKAGRRVIVVDADLGGGNLHTLLGIPYPGSILTAFLNGHCATLEEVLLPTQIPRLSLIAGASDIVGAANPSYSEKDKLIRNLRSLAHERSVDVLILDLGANTTHDTLDFFNLATLGFLVTTPEPTAVENCYGFLNKVIMRDLQREFESDETMHGLLSGDSAAATPKELIERLNRHSPELVALVRKHLKACRFNVLLNVATPAKAQHAFSMLNAVSSRYLNVELALTGVIPRDTCVLRSVEQMTPILSSYPRSPAANAIRNIVRIVGEFSDDA